MTAATSVKSNKGKSKVAIPAKAKRTAPKKTTAAKLKSPSVGIDTTKFEEVTGLLKVYLGEVMSDAVRTAQSEKRSDVTAGDVNKAVEKVLSPGSAKKAPTPKRSIPAVSEEEDALTSVKLQLKDYMNDILRDAVASAKKSKRSEISADDIKGVVSKSKKPSKEKKSTPKAALSKKLDIVLDAVVSEAYAKHNTLRGTPQAVKKQHSEISGKLREFLQDIICESVMSTERSDRSNITGSDIESALEKKKNNKK